MIVLIKLEKNDSPQKRTITAKFLNYIDKEKVLREYISCKLCEGCVYTKEDFSEEIVELRKELFKQAKGLRKRGKVTKVIHDRLISLNARQPPQEFVAGNEKQEIS